MPRRLKVQPKELFIVEITHAYNVWGSKELRYGTWMEGPYATSAAAKGRIGCYNTYNSSATGRIFRAVISEWEEV